MNLIIALTLLITSLAGGGTLYASSNAVPGDALYGVKRSVESARVTLSPNDAALQLEMAGTRLNEAKSLLASGRVDDAKQTLKEYVTEANSARDLLQKSNAAPSASVIQEVEKQKSIITTITTQMPAASPEIEKVKSASHEIEIEIEIKHEANVTATAVKVDDKTKTPEPKTTETPEVKKTETLEVKKTEVPEIKKTDAPEVKKADAPEVKKTDAPEVKKIDVPEVKKAEKPEDKKPEDNK